VKQLPLIGFAPLAHEAEAVNKIKRYTRFTVVIGNPPYSNLSANLNATARALVEKYKFIDSERVVERNALQLERNLNDDYVKFIAWSEDRLDETCVGILSMISNNVYTWSPSLRGMRAHLLKSFRTLRVLDLHGASQRGPSDLRFEDDENVFDIEQPVAVCTLYSAINPSAMQLAYSDFAGPRTSKYEFLLANTLSRLPSQQVTPVPPARRFTPETVEGGGEYSSYHFLADICPLFAEGIKTGRDWLVVDFEKDPILERMKDIQTSKESDDDLCERIGLSRKKAWNFKKARAALAKLDLNSYFKKLAYRPFDERDVFYHPDWIASPCFPVMRNFSTVDSRKRPAKNLAILSGRISRDHSSRLYWCSSQLADKCMLSSLDNVSVFPALVFPESTKDGLDFGATGPEPNLSRDFQNALSEKLVFKKPKKVEELADWTFDVFRYFYAILWSPEYRERYGALLSADFPRLPLTGNLKLFRALARLGGELIALHLLESLKLDHPITEYLGGRAPEVEKVSWSKNTVWLGKAQTTGFRGVHEDVWNFHIGGYQVCEKWLKDRKGRTLSKKDIIHYQKIVVALNETIRLMKEIDDVIEKHGGWPEAFNIASSSASSTEPKETKEYGEGKEDLPLAAEPVLSFGGEQPPALNGGNDDDAPPSVGKARREPVDDGHHIDDIDQSEIMAAIRQVFSDGLARERESAMRDVARELGFDRTGSRIQERLNGELIAAARRGIVANKGGDLTLAARNIDDYGREYLKTLFLSDMGTTWWDREEAINRAARYLGFTRTGARIYDYFKSIINGLIRDGRLESDPAKGIRRI
jgi:hypothetical protein